LVAQGNQPVITLLSLQGQEHQANIKTLSEQLREVQQSPIAQLLQQSQEHQVNIESLSRRLTEVQQLTTDLSRRTQDLHDQIQNQGKQENQIEEVAGYLHEIENLTQAISSNPKNAEFYYQRGLSYQNSGDKQRAMKDYNEAIRLDPRYALAYHDRGFIRSKIGDRKGAIEDLRKATKLYFEQGDFANYQTVRDLSKEIHDLSPHTKDKPSEQAILGGLFSCNRSEGVRTCIRKLEQSLLL